ncbi:hypothetical protein ACHQM5_024641 [Ranunculus cassubicifolius]
MALKMGLDIQFIKKQPIQCVWTKPEEGVVKLNTDGSLSSTFQGYGGLIRDSRGDVKMVYRGSSSMRSILYQEMAGIEQGLKVCAEMQFPKVEVASDSLRAVNVILGKEKVHWEFIKLVMAAWPVRVIPLQIQIHEHG